MDLSFKFPSFIKFGLCEDVFVPCLAPRISRDMKIALFHNRRGYGSLIWQLEFHYFKKILASSKCQVEESRIPEEQVIH